MGDKAFFTVTIDEPYVVELWEHYTAQIQVPYEVTNIRDLTVYELEEFTVSQEVPFVVENPTVHVDIQQEHFTVPVSDKTVHSHAVLHDVNFGVGTGGNGADVVIIDDHSDHSSSDDDHHGR